MSKKNRVNVIGAGVVGLSTGLVLQKNGYKVKIIAEHWPGDLSINYTSPCAGAYFSSNFLFDERCKKFQDISYKTLWELSYINDTGVIRIPNFDFYAKDPHIDSETLLKDIYYKFQVLPKHELPKNVEYGVSFTTDVPKYLRWLLNQFTSAGGVTQKAHLNHLNDAFEPDVNFVINCTGINARTFCGVEDDKVFPTRGQIVIVWAPHIKFAKSLHEEEGAYTYIIPRKSGEVILGGTMDVNNYDGTPDSKTAESILNRCIKLCPELSGVKILRHVVGLRPSRKDGIRLETEIRQNSVGKDVMVCHNYGHHAYGYITSWGSAIEALDLIESSVSNQKEARL
ncbi:7524_t:CDS:2 [Funneliformis geosporum]|uniref:12243_t:CDS:1 n=1 Tax=Funneliformis geosporum TaxID=1117311 RepID=A0A9W4T186_9GLOM|nr:12243_t:CDS:2 [Funneliformis geosporum]CAI2189505.1 7524_t:CDS:2 [Funneliformis geosporum]